jgi:formylglycine-generating enzyme required for sulfatase activity
LALGLLPSCLLGVDYQKVDEAVDAAANGQCAPPGDSPEASSCLGPAMPGSGLCGTAPAESCCSSAAIDCGTFLRSNREDNPLDPDFPATVSTFWLDRLEVTVGRFRRFVDDGMGTAANPPPAGVGGRPGVDGSGWHAEWATELAADETALRAALHCDPSLATWTEEPGAGEEELRPINCVTWYEAFAFCVWDGGRLPTEAEWGYAAAGGAEQRRYPWSVPPSSSELDGSRAVFGCPDDCATGPGPSPVGQRPAGRARWGQLDLAGNVDEWILDWINWGLAGSAFPGPVPCNDCVSLGYPEARARRGGSFASDGASLDELAGATPGSAPPAERSARTGFRCARDPR